LVHRPPRRLRDRLGEEPALAGHFPEWLVNLVLAHGRAHLGAEAVAVGDALAEVAPDMRAFFDGDSLATSRVTET
jgi:hypothetical protein